MNQVAASEFTFSQDMPFLQIFAKLFTGANSTSEMVNGLPNIFCGILVVALVFLFFINKEIKRKRKVVICSLIIAGYWSVRIDDKNRIVFRIVEENLEIIQWGSHYSDK